MRLAEWRPSFEAFLAQPAPWKFLLSWARDAACLPVYCDWTHAIGVTEQGDLLVFEHDASPGSCGLPNGKLVDIRWKNVALHRGIVRYPWLRELLPPRPADAKECSHCNGTGQGPAALICYCGGAGWVPAGDLG